MERDTFGICLNKAMLSENMYSTFTHVRAYEKTEAVLLISKSCYRSLK